MRKSFLKTIFVFQCLKQKLENMYELFWFCFPFYIPKINKKQKTSGDKWFINSTPVILNIYRKRFWLFLLPLFLITIWLYMVGAAVILLPALLLAQITGWVGNFGYVNDVLKIWVSCNCGFGGLAFIWSVWTHKAEVWLCRGINYGSNQWLA